MTILGITNPNRGVGKQPINPLAQFQHNSAKDAFS